MQDDVREALATAGPAIWVPEHREPTGPPALLEDIVALGTGSLAIGRVGDELTLAPVVVDGSRARRAVAGDGVFAALLNALRIPVGALEGRPAVEPIPISGQERGFGVDQTNESAVIGERCVVKLLSRTVPGEQPGVDLPTHLAAVGFDETPAPVGSLWWNGALVATVTSYVPAARDGWEWYVDLVASAAAGDEPWASADEPAPLIGGLVARLHRALATPSPVFPSPVSVAGADVLGGWHSVAAATLEEALGVTDGDAGARLRDLAEAARSAFEGFGRVDRTPVMRIHGDLHVGQVLRAPDGPLLVGDFDGNPLLPAAARNAPHAAARDVASMACAIDHVGRVVTRLQPAATQAIGAWIERSRDAFLTTYRDALGDRSEVFEERLLGAFAVAQEAHEFVYAARYLPRWRYVPDAAMPAVLAWAAAA